MSTTNVDLEGRIESNEVVVVPKPWSKWWLRSVTASASLTLYALIELVIAATNVIPYLRTKMDEAELREGYAKKHSLWFEDFTPHPTLGFTLTPRRTGSPFLFKTDEHGFQEGEVDKDSRVVVLGDSFCYGFGVPYENVWSRFVEKKISKPVANLGVPAYAPWQVNELLKHEPRQGIFDGKVILNTVYANDFAPETSEVAPNYYKVRGWETFQELNPTISNLVDAYYGKRGLNDQNDGWLDRTLVASVWRVLTKPQAFVLVKDEFGRDINLFHQGNELHKDYTGEESKAVVSGMFDEAIKLVQSKGSVLVPVLIPSKLWFYRKQYVEAFGTAEPIILEEQLLNWAHARFASQGIRVIDLRHHLTQAPEQREHRLYLSDGHLSSYGNFVLATAVADYLMKNFPHLSQDKSQAYHGFVGDVK